MAVGMFVFFLSVKQDEKAQSGEGGGGLREMDISERAPKHRP